jgi:hypothetical protein
MVTRDEAEDLPPETVVVTTVTPTPAPVTTPAPESEAPRRGRKPRETATVTEAPVVATAAEMLSVEIPVATPEPPAPAPAEAPAPAAQQSAAQEWFNGWSETHRIPFTQFKERAIENEWPGFEALRDFDTCTEPLQAFLQRSERAILRQFGKTTSAPGVAYTAATA